jgi:hypothetical protein
MGGNPAYLVGVLQVVGGKLEFIGADIFSDPSPTLGGKTIHFVLHEISGDSFEDAVNQMKDYILHMARHSRAWAALLSMMHENSRTFKPRMLPEMPKGQDNG